jgi:steroid delta-isomerase-like uncharacterized protein
MTNDIEKIIKDLTAAWNSHDSEKTISFYTSDCVLEDNGLGEVHHGKKELVAFCKSTFIDFPDLRFKSKSLFNTGNSVAWEWTMTGTHVHSSNPAIPATGKRFSVKGASIIEIHNGKIRRETDYYDALTVRRQLGALKPSTPVSVVQP